MVDRPCINPALYAQLLWSESAESLPGASQDGPCARHERLLMQTRGLPDLTPGPLSHSVHDITELVSLTEGNISIGPSQIVTGELGYLAVRKIGGGELVFSVFGTIIGRQTPLHSIQIGYAVHIDTHDYGGRYVNHHCDGNLKIVPDDRGLHQFVAAKDIKKDEELSYPYWRTELLWTAAAAETRLKCSCGSPICSGRILSFRELSLIERERAFKEGGIAWYLYLERRPER